MEMADLQVPGFGLRVHTEAWETFQDLYIWGKGAVETLWSPEPGLLPASSCSYGLPLGRTLARFPQLLLHSKKP